MNTKTNTVSRAVYRTNKYFEKEAFDSDAFGRKDYAEQLTIVLQRLTQGAVLTIEAEWGEGKTYFARNWAESLERTHGWRVVSIDAFESDYATDPFLVLYGAIRSAIEAQGIKKIPSKLRASGASVLNNLLPLAAKAAVKIGTLNVLDSDDVEGARKTIADALGDASKSFVNEQLEVYEKNRKSVSEFRGLLAEAANEIAVATGHPLVVFVDELDRCRPDYAVRMLERLKHFFEVPNIVYLLVMNRTQIEGAVKGVYGAEIDAGAYLNKFVDFSISLPKRVLLTPGETTDNSNYCAHLARFFGFPERDDYYSNFTIYFGELSTVMGLSFRQIERCFTCFIVATGNRPMHSILSPVMAYLIMLRVTRRQIYLGLLNRNNELIGRLLTEIDAIVSRGINERVAAAIKQVLISYRDRGTTSIGEELIIRPLQHGLHLDHERIVPVLAERIDRVSL